MKKRLLAAILIASVLFVGACSKPREEAKDSSEGSASESETTEESEETQEGSSEETTYTLTFKTKDINGNEVSSEDLFSENDYTMINFWASWCGPCAMEMPELEKLNQDFSENGCGIIGILVDGDKKEGLSDGKEVVEETGVTYPVVVPWDTFFEEIGIQAFPTSVFVNSAGEIVSGAIVGVDMDAYATTLDGLLSQ